LLRSVVNVGGLAAGALRGDQCGCGDGLLGDIGVEVASGVDRTDEGVADDALPCVDVRIIECVAEVPRGVVLEGATSQVPMSFS
jgi:hypothetical protein